MKTVTLLLCFVTATVLTAQTKQIAHRSHGGSPETFSLAASADNFGLLPTHYYERDTSRIDSIFLKARARLHAEPEKPDPIVDSLPVPGGGRQKTGRIDSMQPSISGRSLPGSEQRGSVPASFVPDRSHSGSRLLLLSLGIGAAVGAIVFFAIRRREQLLP